MTLRLSTISPSTSLVCGPDKIRAYSPSGFGTNSNGHTQTPSRRYVARHQCPGDAESIRAAVFGAEIGTSPTTIAIGKTKPRNEK